MTAPISPLAALAALQTTAQALVQGTASRFDLVAGDLNQLPNFYGTIVHTGTASGRPALLFVYQDSVTGDRTWVSPGQAVPGLQPALDQWVADERLRAADDAPVVYSQESLVTNSNRRHYTPVDANGLMVNSMGQIVTFSTRRLPGWTADRIVWDWTQIARLAE